MAALVDLAVLDDVSWDRSVLQTNEIDVLAIMDRLLANFHQAAPLLTTGGVNVLSGFAQLLGVGKTYVAARLQSSGVSSVTQTGQPTNVDTNMFNGIFDLDFLDNELYWSFPATNQQTNAV